MYIAFYRHIFFQIQQRRDFICEAKLLYCVLDYVWHYYFLIAIFNETSMHGVMQRDIKRRLEETLKNFFFELQLRVPGTSDSLLIRTMFVFYLSYMHEETVSSGFKNFAIF